MHARSWRRERATPLWKVIVAIHVKIVGGFFTVFGIVAIALGLWILKGIVQSAAELRIMGVIFVVPAFLLGWGSLQAGLGLLGTKPGARKSGILCSVLMFAFFALGPAIGFYAAIIGGIIGGYCLWVLMDSSVKQLFDEHN